jgi:hypothetical protein
LCQTKKASCVLGGGSPKLEWIVAPSRRDLRESVRNPRGLVPFSAERNRREIWRIGLDEQPVARYQPQQVVVAPLLERYDPGERDVPPRIERKLGEGVCASVAVQDADHPTVPCIANDRPGVVFGIAGVDDNRLSNFFGQRDLSRERGALRFSRGVVVVIVEATFADGHRGAGEQAAQLRDVADRVKRSCVVRMNSGSREHESGIVRRDLRGNSRRRERLPDAHDRERARIAGARDYRVAVAFEGRVREVGVAVDED